MKAKLYVFSLYEAEIGQHKPCAVIYGDTYEECIEKFAAEFDNAYVTSWAN